MNCQELKEDINKLHELHDSLSASYKKMNETGVGNRETQRINRKVTELEDKLLKKYLDDFAEKNPEMFPPKFGEKIEGFNHDINTLTKLSDDMVFVGGERGEARILRKKDGEWKFDDEIEGFDKRIWTLTKLSDDMVFVGGERGEARILRKKDGEWEFDDEIEGFNKWIYTSTKLSDDMVFVGGKSGEARILKQEDISLDTLKKHIKDIAKKGEA